MSSKKNIKAISNSIRDIPDFPKKGIVFKDITPVLANINLFRQSIDAMIEPYIEQRIDVVVGIESRGFIFGTPIADKLNAPFVPIRKPGKLPWNTERVKYELEYGTDTLEIHTDAIKEGQNILIVDDLLATGGTAEAACKLVSKMKGTIKGLTVLVELEFLKGREKLNPYNVHSIVKY
tara:strand:+ start:355 stop:888 length:534 start_codon:yes stop_codon:yes gene_type:complete